MGFDYTFDYRRDKNKALRRKYLVDDAKMKKILLNLTGAKFVKSEQSTNVRFPNDVVYIFKTVEELIPRYDDTRDFERVCIYIKVTWPDGEEPMFIISFHEDEG